MTITFSAGAAESKPSIAASAICSKLSATRSSCLVAQVPLDGLQGGTPHHLRDSRGAGHHRGTRAGSVTDDKSAKKAPSLKSGSSSAAT